MSNYQFCFHCEKVSKKVNPCEFWRCTTDNKEALCDEQCPYDDLCDSAGCRWDAERKVFKCGKVKR